MKFLFTLLLCVSGPLVQAQSSLLLNGMRAATSAATLAARKSKANAHKKAGAAPEAATPSSVGRPAPVTPFTYQGQVVSRQRTAAGTLKGKGVEQIMALEAALEQSHQALLADSVQPFLPATQTEAIMQAAREAAAARPGWNYAAYQQELAFYQQEDARRQQALLPAPAAPVKPGRKPRK
ncbi:hypothetical protein KLP40_04580 [Hymenobacter sp. NST-14]|uniref:hypothetical protein n=1 Tax=Hymenobacter piscis TaxID=2839984 RepID=UPI001C017671|nr:hypothetical protein [Hymenobacter piscis]MBT9392431.1 hypothetical protein [Hymenobacter piscis]